MKIISNILKIAAILACTGIIMVSLVVSFTAGKYAANPTTVHVKANLGNKVFQVFSFSETKVEDGKTLYKDLGEGTAFVMERNGKQLFISNAHVCADMNDLKVARYAKIKLPDGNLQEVDIVRIDADIDICVMTTKSPYGISGLRASDEPVSHVRHYGTMGFNGVDMPVAQVGTFIGSRIVYSVPDPSINHQMTRFGFVLNNINLSEEERMSFCPSTHQVQRISHPLKRFNPTIPDMFLCLKPEKQDVYNFHTYSGASGSPVIDMTTGRLVGVVSQFVGERHYGGVVPLSDVLKVIDSL